MQIFTPFFKVRGKWQGTAKAPHWTSPTLKAVSQAVHSDAHCLLNFIELLEKLLERKLTVLRQILVLALIVEYSE